MQENICLQCKKTCDGSTSRLVHDSCGHKKCRVCLLEDEEKCKQCTLLETNKNNQVVQTDKESVIKFENKAAVITCNGSASSKNQPEKKPLVNDVSYSKDMEQKSHKAKSCSRLKGRKPQKDINKRAYNTINIPSHIAVTADPLVYHCSICNKGFTTKAHVKYHMYCAGVKPHKCDICSKEFVLKTQLEVHILKHTGIKPHICSICQKSFSERSKLNRHVKLHTPIKSHVCSDCGKAFRSRESLRLHSIIHKGERPFACKLCSAKFNNSSNLSKHLISHSVEKIHMCDQCGKRFKLKWALTVHKRSHLRLKMYQCSLCLKAFVNNKDLQRHSLVHIETKGFTCSICRTSFRRKDNLSRHMKNTHPGRKGEIIKNTVAKPPVVPRVKPVDNPNAINVITASPSFSRKTEPTPNKSESRVGTVINGPIKLAFKTPAFKNSYNIHRDFDYVPPAQMSKTYDLAESVNICQKILSPHSPLPPPITQTDESTSTKICQNILSSYPTPKIHYETSFQNRKDAMIKNIKFKVPIQYTTNTSTSDPLKDITPLKPAALGSEGVDNVTTNNNTYTELKPIINSATSVIVNANQPVSMHWRRRTSQNLNLKS